LMVYIEVSYTTNGDIIGKHSNFRGINSKK
jgi:hypothetical protein